jgi:hypothetical protein
MVFLDLGPATTGVSILAEVKECPVSHLTIAQYAVQDEVIISLGDNQGTFVCIQPVSGVAPYTGAGYWVQLPGGLLGQWK